MSVPHPEWLISNRRKWEEVEVDSKQVTVGGLKGGMMENVRQELVFHAKPGHCTFRHEADPSVGQQGEQALPAVYVKEQTSEDLVQKKQPRLINVA